MAASITAATLTSTATSIKEVAATSAAAEETAAEAEAADEDCKDDDDDELSTTLRSCANEPDFAIICAFLQKFAKDLGLDLPNFKHLQEWLTNNDQVSDRLRDLHIKLLRKTRKTVHEKSWESALSKFCFWYSVQDAWEIERFGYKNSSLKVKLRILRELLESQFERNAKFRAKLLTLSADSLRVQPIGRDRHGHAYWLTQDDDCNLRIYQEHLDEEIWQVVATNRDEFVQLIKRLRGNEVVLPSKDIGEVDEDTSSSNSCGAPQEKPPPPEEQEDDSTQDEEPAKLVPNLKIKLNTLRHSDESIEPAEDETKIRKVKPLVITQAKLAAGSPASVGDKQQSKKRSHEDSDKSSPNRDEIQIQKKHRPTLLDAKRIKKPSRYETPKSEDDNEQDSDLDEQESDLEEQEDDEEDDDELDGEEEDIDSAAAEEDENEEKDIEEDDDDDEEEDEEEEEDGVGEAIEDPVVNVRGQGAGRDCKDSNDLFLCDYNSDNEELIVGEAIEEPIMFVIGNGEGAGCQVGNKTETSATESAGSDSKPKFFFGEPGCLKLSPIKQTPKPETKRSIFDSLSNETKEKSDNENEKDEEAVDSTAEVNEIEENKAETSVKTNGERTKIVCESTETKAGVTEGVKQQELEESKEISEKEVKKEANNVAHVEEKPIKNGKEIETNFEDPDNLVSFAEEAKVEHSNIDKEKCIEIQKSVVPNTEKKKTKSDTSEEKKDAEKEIKEEQQKEEEIIKETLPECAPTVISKDLPEAKPSTELDLSDKVKAEKQPIDENKTEEKVKVIVQNNTNEKQLNESTEKSIKQEKNQIENVIDTEPKEAETITEKAKIQTETRGATSESSNVKQMATNLEKINEKSKTTENKIQTQKETKNEEERSEETGTTTKLKESTLETITPKITMTATAVTNEIKVPLAPTTNSSTSTKSTGPTASATTPSNRKRRLTDFAAVPQLPINIRHSTSESEIDLHSELNEEEPDDLDIGGKRIKMRPKLTHTELRRKVEAQKTQIDETTSSSGEEESRSRRKIITPKRKLEPPIEKTTPVMLKKDDTPKVVTIERNEETTKSTIKNEKEEAEPTKPQPLEMTKNHPLNLLTEKLENPIPIVNKTPPAVERPVTVPKQKPTLAEIIEKKLKKTPEKSIVEKTQEVTPPVPPASTSNTSTVATVAMAEVPTATFTPPKKSPVTKPLKKNLLTQIRQEESDEEAIPRKRTISETATVTATTAAITTVSTKPPLELLESTTVPQEILAQPAEVIVERRTPDRQTPERQRKRRSSEDAKQLTEDNKTSTSTEDVGVSGKLKRANEVIEEQKAPVKRDELVVEKTKIEQIKSEKELTPAEPAPAAETEVNTLPTIGRRSGRRGAAAVVYSELPQPKRTRGGVKAVEKKSEVVKDEPEVAEEKPKPKSVPPTAPVVSPKKLPPKAAQVEHKPAKGRPPNKALAAKKVETKKEPAVKIEPKSEQASPKVTATTPTTKSNNSTEASPPVVTPPKAATPAVGPGRGRGPRKQREVDATNIIESNDNDTPVRQSRRIAQQKIKEEAERRKLEEIALRTMKEELKKKKKAEKQCDPTVVEPSGESSSSESEVELKKKTKKKPGKDGWSSGSEEQADTEEEEEEPPHEDTDPGSPLFKSDHEFSPESDLEDESQLVPMKRARTARKENAEEGEEENADEACQKCGKSDHPEWILLCDICDKGYHCSCLSPVLFYIPEGDWFCPPCQQEQLINALEKQLQEFDELVVRKEQEKRLAAEKAEREERERLEEEERQKMVKKSKDKHHGHGHDSDDSNDDGTDKSDKASNDSDDGSNDESRASKPTSKRIKQAEKSDKSKRRRGDGRSNRRAAKRGTRRRRRNDSGSGSNSKSDNDSGSGSESESSSSTYSDSDDEPIYKLRKRRQINVSYRLNEYDDLINSALKKEMDEVAGAGNLGRGKDITTIIEADKEEKARLRQIEADESGEDDETSQLEVKQVKEKKTSQAEGGGDEDDDDDEDDDVPLKVKSRSKPTLKKKTRKLTTLDISSEEDHVSDEDFKTSSFDDEDEDTSISNSESDSDSSLEVYRRRGKHGGKKQRKAARRAARERRKDRKFVVDGSDESEEEARPKIKKKRKEDSDYTETETDDDDELSELSENLDSADLCDDTTSESSDGAWHPSKRKKQRKSTLIARKSPKLKKPQMKKPKRVEYSDDDISESEPEEDDDDEDDAPGSGKGSGKQPRSQPLKPQLAKVKTKSPATAKKKKKPLSSDENSGSDDSTRRTRGRRYAYLEDFDDESSDGGIKPGVKRPDTPPEERQKFIEKQEEIKRMLAEKNAEGAKLAATPRLTPIKGTAAVPGTDKRTPTKASDSLSTVPLSVIRQAKVLDIDYLQRKGETIGEMENVDDVESDFGDADLPDDLPEVMDEDAIARMVEEDDEFNEVAARDLPPPDEVLRTPNKAKILKTEVLTMGTTTATELVPKPPTIVAVPTPPTQAVNSGLLEPLRKRLPMPTLHPPLLRHQYPPQQGLPPHLLQRHGPPPMQLLQNALSAPLGQPLQRSAYGPPPPSHHGQQPLPPHAGMQRLTLPSGMPPAAHGIPPAHIMRSVLPPNAMREAGAAAAAAALSPPPQQHPHQPPVMPPVATTNESQQKPRGRRKKITPLRDPLQKQQTAAAVTAASTTASEKPANDSIVKSTATSTATSLVIAQAPQLYKSGAPSESVQPSVITRLPHLPPHVRPPPPTQAGAGVYADLHARFYGQPLPPTSTAGGGRPVVSTVGAPPSTPPRHLLRPQLPPGMSPRSALRPTYGPPPPLRGAPPPTSTQPPPTSSASGMRGPPFLHGDHHGGPPPLGSGGMYGAGPGGPPPARHAATHLNPYRQPIYGNPNFAPRVGPPPPPATSSTGNLRPGAPPTHAVDYAAAPPPRPYPPYGYYPPPPPLTTPLAHTPQPTPATQLTPPTIPTNTSVPSSVIVSAPPAAPPPTSTAPAPAPAPAVISVAPPPTSIPTNHSVSALTRNTSNKPPAVISPPLTIIEPTKATTAPITATAVSLTATSVITETRSSNSNSSSSSKQLTTLEAYSKSPLTVAGESSGSPAADVATEDSSSTPGNGSTTTTQTGASASEFSGLVSYFSSQHDDYNT